MSLQYALAVLAICSGVVPPVAAQKPALPGAIVYRLRNTAAVDVAQALTAFATEKKLSVSIIAEPVSNTVLVAGAPVEHKQLAALVSAIDKAPPLVAVQMMIMNAPSGFEEDVGLGDGDSWVLTPRETRMLTAAIRKDKNLEILSRPMFIVADNQTGFVQVGNGTAVTSRFTPRITPDGDSIMVRVEASFAKPTGANNTEIQNAQTTVKVLSGGIVVIRCPRSKLSDGGTREVLMLLSVERVSPEEGQ